MAFISDEKVGEIQQGIVTDLPVLGKLYKSKKNQYIERSVEYNELDDYLNRGWEKVRELKTKCKIRKQKSHSKFFEDQLWCQFYELGYRKLNRDENFKLPFSNDPKDQKQIDVFAVDGETAFIIESKSSEKLRKAPSFKDEFDNLRLRMNGYRKTIQQIYGKEIKIQYVFATRNLRITEDGVDMKRLSEAGGYHFSDNTFEYINNLIKNYKNAARYQFLALIFKDKKINNELIEIPAIQGKMGNKTYYMFSIEPSLLLKIGFILHRTKANDGEMPTYQRILAPSRLPKITGFIDDGGYFPNSLIINFNESKKLYFEGASKTSHTKSRFGTLKIPNEYASAYIIDGQHRLYGYANSRFLETNTVPVVAMHGLDSTEQLGIFMDINQNQKAVSPSLRLVLEEDLFWNSDKLESRIKALKSSITKKLATDLNCPLYNKISIGEESALLTFKPFYTALTNCGLVPKAKGNKFIDATISSSLYNINNQDDNQAMLQCKNEVSGLINICYEYIEENAPELYVENKFILSNRGTYAFIMLLGSLNNYLTEINELSKKTLVRNRFDAIKPFLKILIDGLKALTSEENKKYMSMKGQGADHAWFKLFQSIINKKHSSYEPEDLIDWRERQDKSLQIRAKELADNAERAIKSTVIDYLEKIYGEEWELEIADIQSKCHELAQKENAERRKNGIEKRAGWTEMLTIHNYKTIIEKSWSKKPDEPNSKSFGEVFSIDIGEGVNSKAEKLKWMLHLNDYRKTIAHSGSKEEGLNIQEVDNLEKIYDLLVKQLEV